MTTIVASTAFGNNYVDGILHGRHWGGPITYSFADQFSDLGPNYPHTITGMQAVSAQQQFAIRYILGGGNDPTAANPVYFPYGSFADVSNLQISLAANPNGPSDMPFFEVDTVDGANVPSAQVMDLLRLDQRIDSGDVAFGNDGGQFRSPTPGTYAWVTHIHEIGHALGLSHAHNSGGSIFGATVPIDRSGEEFSVMSYHAVPNDYLNGVNDERFGHAQTLMQLDILALQHLYGANYGTNAGNTVYQWSTTTGEMSVNGVGQGLPGAGHVDANKIFLTVWDGNGTDTYDLSNYTTNMHLDLSPGGFSKFNPAQVAVKGITQQVVQVQPFEAHTVSGNVYNAYMFNGDTRSLIENGFGGSGNDWVEGNIANNTLRGNNGSDTLNGREGNDVLIGGNGNDVLFGDARQGGPAFNASGYLQLSNNTDNHSAPNAFDLTPFVGRRNDANVRNSDTNPSVTVDVNGNRPFGAFTGQDFFRIDVTSPGLVVFDIDFGTRNIFNPTQFDINLLLTLSNAQGILLSQSDETQVDPGSFADLPAQPGGAPGTEDPHIVFNVAEPGTYFLTLDNHIAGGVFFGTSYRLSITLPNHDETPASMGNDVLIGGAGADDLFGQGGNDILNGGLGADDLSGGTGVDRVDYTNATAGLRVDLANAAANTGEAAGDTFTSIESLRGSAFTDDLRGTDARNFLEGLGGNDVLTGRGNRDVLLGHAGNDVLVGGEGNDVLNGGSGRDRAQYTDSATGLRVDLQFAQVNNGIATGDTFISVEDLRGTNADDDLRGDAGANRIEGLGGNDFLTGRGGNDVLVAGAGNDVLLGGTGTDSLNGGSGRDRASYSDATSGVTVDLLLTANNAGAYAAGDTFAFIEDLQGSGSADSLRGDNGANTLIGGNGDDVLTGRGGADHLLGGNGDDLLTGGGGADALNGGAGSDRASYADSGTGLRVDLQFAQLNNGIATNDTFVSVENLRGSAGADDLRGDGGANIVEGGNGNDYLTGRAGSDTMFGGNGDDVLRGGAGIDRLTGNGGSDSFRFDAPSDGFDVLVDFTSGKDTILLDDAGFGSLATGTLNAGRLRFGSQALDPNDFLIYDQGARNLYYDADGNGAGAAVRIAILIGSPDLDATDFLIV